MGPVTTNPWLIALINMTIVFGVLIALGVMMSLLQVIDPTKKKVAKPAAVAAAPVQDDSEIFAVIAAAVAGCGCSTEQIACIRRVKSDAWNVNARAEAISVRKECF